MNGKSRYLPRLNLCYLQKKAYEVHLKKMNTIQHRSRKTFKMSSNSPQTYEGRLASLPRNRMPTVEEITQKRIANMNPYKKKVLEQTERENMRLFQAIQKCPSTINRRVMTQHSYLSQSFKERLCRFAIMPGSKKTLLKCQISLDKINKKERQSRLRTFTSNQSERYASRVRKDVITQASERKQMFRSLQSSKTNERSHDFLLKRSQNKINNHFQRSQISLRTKQKLQGFRQNIESSNKMHSHQIYKWKTRCFTTQMEQHSKQTQ